MERKKEKRRSVIKKPLKKGTAEETADFDKRFKSFFDSVAGDDEELDAFELTRVFQATFKKELKGNAKFSLEACRSMLAMNDKDRNGKINYAEFREMWRLAMHFKTTYDEFYKQQNEEGQYGLTMEELDKAMQKLGYEINPDIIKSVFTRYANKRGVVVAVDDYIQICCRIKSLYDAYSSFPFQRKEFTLDDYIQSTIYC